MSLVFLRFMEGAIKMPRVLTSIEEFNKILDMIKKYGLNDNQLFKYFSSNCPGHDLDLNDLSKLSLVENNDTILTFACKHNRDAAKILLMTTNADVRKTDNSGRTPLLVAITQKPISKSLCAEIIKKMLELKVVANELEIAEIKKHALEEHGPEVQIMMQNLNEALQKTTVAVPCIPTETVETRKRSRSSSVSSQDVRESFSTMSSYELAKEENILRIWGGALVQEKRARAISKVAVRAAELEHALGDMQECMFMYSIFANKFRSCAQTIQEITSNQNIAEMIKDKPDLFTLQFKQNTQVVSEKWHNFGINYSLLNTAAKHVDIVLKTAVAIVTDPVSANISDGLSVKLSST
jgi:hypothetical protein